ncbi:hypothetical protein ES703_60902 [subsurface metagenome]
MNSSITWRSQKFSNIFKYFQTFSNIFKRFTPLFEYFRKFSNVFERFILACFAQPLQLNTSTPIFDSKTHIQLQFYPKKPPFFYNSG